MGEKIGLKIDWIDNGFCCIHYTMKVKGRKLHFCIQEELDDVFETYLATPDGEPETAVVCKDFSIWEMPTGNSHIEKSVRNFLQKSIQKEVNSNG